MNLGILNKLRSMVGNGMGKMALTALHKNLQDTVKHDVNWFQLIYTKQANEMYFTVLCPDGIKRDCKFPDGSKIITIVESMIKESLPDGSVLDALVLEYDNTFYRIIAAYTDAKGEKIKIEQPLDL